MVGGRLLRENHARRVEASRERRCWALMRALVEALLTTSRALALAEAKIRRRDAGRAHLGAWGHGSESSG